MPPDTLFIGVNGHVIAIDPADGSELWRTRLGGGGLFSATGYEDVCVLRHDDRIYAGCHGHLFCLDVATGEEVWHNSLSGVGYNDVTLALGDKAVHFVASRAGRGGTD